MVSFPLAVPIMKSILMFLSTLAVAHAGVAVPLTAANIDAFLKSHNTVRAALKIPALVSFSFVGVFGKFSVC